MRGRERGPREGELTGNGGSGGSRGREVWHER